jgi:hypothetical protein
VESGGYGAQDFFSILGQGTAANATLHPFHTLHTIHLKYILFTIIREKNVYI